MHVLHRQAIVDPDLGHCKGYGFVMFERDECAKAALESLLQRGLQVIHSSLWMSSLAWHNQVAYARAPKNPDDLHEQPEPDPTNLYVSGIPLEYSEPQA